MFCCLKYVNVQPNDGFGTLLPNETIKLDINFCPKSAKEYKFSVTCKSIVNRDFTITCKGIGVHPPLKLSAQRINFKATPLNSTSFRTIYIVNDHLDCDEHRHPVPRIGNGEIARVGPTMFEFALPDTCPFTVSPKIGVVGPGQKTAITVEYKAVLADDEIRREACKLLKQSLLRKQQEQEKEETASLVSGSLKPSESSKRPPRQSKVKQSTVKVDKSESLVSGSVVTANVIEPSVVKTPDIETVEVGSLEYLNGQMRALESYKSNCEHFQVPCYVASLPDDPAEKLSFSIYNTLYLDIICPSVRPELIVISNANSSNSSKSSTKAKQTAENSTTSAKNAETSRSRMAANAAAVLSETPDNSSSMTTTPSTMTTNSGTFIDFGKVSVGNKCIKSIIVKNISPKTVKLSSNLLDTNGPFIVLNSLRTLEPNETFNLMIGFIPPKNEIVSHIFIFTSALI